jgi:hypothetical protein
MINSASSGLGNFAQMPPGSSAVLNLSGAETTAYWYGFLFGP